MFQNIGAGAYKPGLTTTRLLDKYFGHPHKQFKTIHVAGTNGKGSCSHTLAAVLQQAGFKVGLFTSPHLLDFRERIRVNGKMVPEKFVVDFVKKHRPFFEPLHPSFFELTTAMAFHFFAKRHVDIAVIEVGLGGRLDCTNIIHPELCVITNISLDHTQFLGHTPEYIAREKAGIIKRKVPVVIGETTPETRPVFEEAAAKVNAPIVFAEDKPEVVAWSPSTISLADKKAKTKKPTIQYRLSNGLKLEGELTGLCQEKNTNTILHAIRVLERLHPNRIGWNHIKKSFKSVCHLTGLQGRWQTIHNHPLAICDTGHNIGGFEYISRQLKDLSCHQLRIVIGMAADKDIHAVLDLLPQNAVYYFCKAQVDRGVNAERLQQQASSHGLLGHSYPSVASAYQAALEESDENDFIFVGGSTFVVAEVIPNG